MAPSIDSGMGATYDDFVVVLQDHVRFLQRTRSTSCDVASLLEAFRHFEFASSKAKAEADAVVSDILQASHTVADELDGVSTDSASPSAADSVSPPAGDSASPAADSDRDWKPTLAGSAAAFWLPSPGKPKRWADKEEEA